MKMRTSVSKRACSSEPGDRSHDGGREVGKDKRKEEGGREEIEDDVKI